ncbi:hypothetical protein Wenmar_03721 [Wenxinia marina DSM 24838]|uniref:Polysaccharide pyruvyl transferase domain-containing protein n=2 Tax=Wenxinia TaxID=653686 RepID=A0A0D0P864_9RHOB|nr:hypothetical protein Wenmar_03721 [Wenxinia marina DSM 24838]
MTARFEVNLAEMKDLSTRRLPRGRQGRRLLVLPPDPLLVTASRGDQAMIAAIMDHYRSLDAGWHVVIGCDVRTDRTRAIPDGAEALTLYGRGAGIGRIRDRIHGEGITDCLLVGADVLDGSFNPVFSLEQLRMLHAARMAGCAIGNTGFSYSADSAPRMREAFGVFPPHYRFAVRDPISLRRFADAVGDRGRRTADIAFLLRPAADTPRTAASRAWIADRRDEGRHVIAMNLHPVLDRSDGVDSRTLIERYAIAARDLSASRPGGRDLAIYLMPHDFRGADADDHCLRPLLQRVREAGVPVFHPGAELDAAQCKAILADCDLAVGARMHLLIGALGAGCPIVGIEYRGKIRGLAETFDLPADRILQPTAFMESSRSLQAAIAAALGANRDDRRRIRDALPHVLGMAADNFRLAPAVGSPVGVDPV